MSQTQPAEQHFTRKAVIRRLKKLLKSTPLTVSVMGGGLPTRQTLSPEHAVLISRGDVDFVLQLLTPKK